MNHTCSKCLTHRSSLANGGTLSRRACRCFVCLDTTSSPRGENYPTAHNQSCIWLLIGKSLPTRLEHRVAYDSFMTFRLSAEWSDRCGNPYYNFSNGTPFHGSGIHQAPRPISHLPAPGAQCPWHHWLEYYSFLLILHKTRQSGHHRAAGRGAFESITGL